MRRLTLLCVMLLVLTGCATIERITTGAVTKAAVVTNQTLDTIGAPITELVEQWCTLLDYRQEHLGGLVNGRLASQNKSIVIDCDTRNSRTSIFEG